MEHKHFDDASIDSRFWPKVEFTPTCWLWSASKTGVGYGQIAQGRKKPPLTVHRLVWVLYHGAIPEGLFVLHKCDVRHCCNPEHLFLGTAADNTADMIAKGRQKTGGRGPSPAIRERHGMAKLTESQVSEIRRRYASGEVTQVQLGVEYGVSGAHVCGIIKGKFWPQDVPALRSEASGATEGSLLG